MAIAGIGKPLRVLLLGLGLATALTAPTLAAPGGGILSVFGFGEDEPAAAPTAPPAPVEPPVLQAQTMDPQYGDVQLQEQLRALNGRIEELGFQMLQMQEQMRQMQEDNEFRFQSLEGGAPATDRTAIEPSTTESIGTAGASTGAGTGTTTTTNAGSGLPGVAPDATQTPPAGTATAPAQQTLGSMTFDDQGNLAETLESTAPGANATTGTDMAALPVDDPDALYRDAYDYVLSGDYALAEAAFKDYIDIHPDGGQIADAHFWLGESQYSQGSFNDSARTFLNAHQNFPDAEKAPEMLLKLGMSLAALDNRDTACATYREVLSRYPQATQTVRDKVASEQRTARC